MTCLRIAYDGSGFSGSQRQPSCRTIENSLIDALTSVGCIDRFEDLAAFRMASRTDKGVSARENLLNIECPCCDLRGNNALERINNSLDAIWITGYSEENFKMPLEKTYHYHLVNNGYDTQLTGELCKLFSGDHDFALFSKFNPEKETVRHLNMDYEFSDETITLIYDGKGFLWQMCRRIATAFVECLEGRMTLEDIERMMDGSGEKLRPAEAANLVLYAIGGDIAFEDVPGGLERLKHYYKKRMDSAKTALGIGHDFVSDP